MIMYKIRLDLKQLTLVFSFGEKLSRIEKSMRYPSRIFYVLEIHKWIPCGYATNPWNMDIRSSIFEWKDFLA